MAAAGRPARIGPVAGALLAAAAFAGCGGRSGPVGAVSAPTTVTTPPTTAAVAPTTAPVGHHSHGSSGSFVPTSDDPPTVAVAGAPPMACPPATVRVATAPQLQAALLAARPGSVISLADGVYGGRFSGTGSGTAGAPIWVCGGQRAIIDDSGDQPGAARAPGAGAYGFHLVDASYWRLVGFSVRNAQKGVMLDRSSNNVLHGLTVYHVGDEAIHLRDLSSNNLVEACTIRATGLRVAKFGEGIYVGTAVHNWGTYSGGNPDTSDHNAIRWNDLADTTAENIDIKEGTSGGDIAFNHLDGAGLVPSAATSWVNVKGNDYQIHDNTGVTSAGDGFSTHRIIHGAGSGNTFSANHVGADVAGYGFAIHSKGNTVSCSNTGQGQEGISNVTCTP